MKVRLYTRISSGAKRRYVPVNRNKIYRDGTVFCLRYARRWETLATDGVPDPAASAAFFRRKVGEPRIPEFFSHSIVSLVTAKGEPGEVE
jgi:hypothetical protein